MRDHTNTRNNIIIVISSGIKIKILIFLAGQTYKVKINLKLM